MRFTRVKGEGEGEGDREGEVRGGAFRPCRFAECGPPRAPVHSMPLPAHGGGGAGGRPCGAGRGGSGR
eukprot:9903217-Lingulodinium_polyedra.AAC.1